MLDTNDFVEQLITQKYSHLCVVPCSFAKDLINAAINHNSIEYTPCASEAVACSVAAGLKMAGKNPIVIVQSSGLTNMGSCITSLLKPYAIRFPIIVSWRSYTTGDSEIQHQHLATKLPDLVSAYGYEHTILDDNDIKVAISQINECNDKNQICLLKKSTFSKVELLSTHTLDLSQHLKRSVYLQTLNNEFKDTNTIFIGTTGNTAREMYSFMPNTNNFYMAGNMGGALSVGLGLAKAGKKVVVCGGDAEFVMHMGGLTTAGRYADAIDLTYILFDNESNKSTGGQNTYQKHINYTQISKNSNFTTIEANNLEEFTQALKPTQANNGANFVYIKCDYDQTTPRPPIDKVANCEF